MKQSTSAPSSASKLSKTESATNLIESVKKMSFEELEIRPGSKVKIVGLKKFPKFNGQEGRITEGKDVFWTVSIPSLNNHNVRVRSVNLEVIDEPVPEEKNPELAKLTPKALKAKKFITWLTKELAENEPEDPAEFTFALLKSNLTTYKLSMFKQKLEELEKALDKAVADHKFLLAHEIKEEIRDLKSKENDIHAVEDKLVHAMKDHEFLLAHDLKEKMKKMINTPSKFSYKHWINSLKASDRAKFITFTKGTERTLEWVTGLTIPDLRGAIHDPESVRRIWSSIKELRATYM
mmetsp:Transcript_11730/g.28907  ORF Transcript_11730/g.28907 Transcript_11730/m.28907 type:complete len:293 (-) Transcript_11730:425-1303(-)|eukprot:CAMPEP_0114501944 /NCGR_PEP_ID=MMETSP0109-20121206/8777_1 /TAXON_ID=29199 /ORGANISM="Chlorarachnion reptans, Strain CCCM449" /LENGTH=292 /DNA_ID=CAMNT_0001679725 /DNA_START=305 /DNA_END=1183 /DNA_ORIENTATION=-